MSHSPNRSTSLNLKDYIQTLQALFFAKMTANGAAKDYSVISQKDPEKDAMELKVQTLPKAQRTRGLSRGGICPSRHCQRQCKIFASGVNFSIFSQFLCFFPLKLLKLGEIDGVKFLA